MGNPYAWAPWRDLSHRADGERDNVTVLRDVLRAMDMPGDDFDWVRDRPDHDRRHAIGASKLRRELA